MRYNGYDFRYNTMSVSDIYNEIQADRRLAEAEYNKAIKAARTRVSSLENHGYTHRYLGTIKQLPTKAYGSDDASLAQGIAAAYKFLSSKESTVTGKRHADALRVRTLREKGFNVNSKTLRQFGEYWGTLTGKAWLNVKYQYAKEVWNETSKLKDEELKQQTREMVSEFAKRSEAAKKGWVTRRFNKEYEKRKQESLKRSKAAKKGWETRRKKQQTKE